MLYFVRHGATDWNDNINENGEKDPKCQGRADIPLNERGKRQAAELAKTIKDIKFDRVICSPLTRTRQTCEIIYKGDKPIEIDPRIIEMDFGQFEGQRRSEVSFKHLCNIYEDHTNEIMESYENMQNRIYSFIEELSKKPNDNVLVVSHGGVGCFVLSYFNGLPKDGNMLRYEVPNAEPMIFDLKKMSKKVEIKESENEGPSM